MSRLRLTLLGTGALFASLATASLAATPYMLRVNTGLWEITNNVRISGMQNMMGMDPATMAQMKPEMRARMQAAMSAMNGLHVSKVKTCVTQKDLDHPFKPGSDQPGEKCNYDVMSGTATDESVHVSCTGRQTMSGTFHFSAPTPASMTGHMDMAFNEQGHAMTMSNDLSGKWLGQDCGSVKPNED